MEHPTYSPETGFGYLFVFRLCPPWAGVMVQTFEELGLLFCCGVADFSRVSLLDWILLLGGAVLLLSTICSTGFFGHDASADAWSAGVGCGLEPVMLVWAGIDDGRWAVILLLKQSSILPKASSLFFILWCWVLSLPVGVQVADCWLRDRKLRIAPVADWSFYRTVLPCCLARFLLILAGLFDHYIDLVAGLICRDAALAVTSAGVVNGLFGCIGGAPLHPR
ncbi:hypothetical protein Nepgr_009381 [Nepenthes gracilis]|uniref:Uncharacterized protein n=1 Tax=Nepenthes gracilis TaxID=150966 RepID=A0AAD3SAR8_NEPGR|nr:hypothetical protein Nepgr_009381 [Nepenthes gracilis]